MPVSDDALRLHEEKKGKIKVVPKVNVADRESLSIAYTPGVAAVSMEIRKKPDRVWDLTMKGNSVAVVSDGSAVLGLGDIGPEAALPVMEGKALLFKEFAGIDAFPVCIRARDVDEIVSIVKSLSPSFGGINLEDISAPRCFEIEEKLQDIGIPVFHDDQHGTAIVVLAGLINAASVVGKNIEDMRVVISGAGAAGTAIVKLLLCIGYDKRVCRPVKEIIVCDSRGVIGKHRRDLEGHKRELSELTNRSGVEGSLADAMEGADAFIGVSAGNIVSEDMVRSMAEKAIVFAMANPVPEIMPEKAKKAGAVVVATGRSDYPNQINNVLAFPGVFRGALDCRASVINNEMKLAAAYALADLVENPSENKIIPNPFDRNVVSSVAKAVSDAAKRSGACRTAGEQNTRGN